MRKIFLSEDSFNIFDLLSLIIILISLIIILIGIFKQNIVYIHIGIYIQVAQRIPRHFKEYRNIKNSNYIL